MDYKDTLNLPKTDFPMRGNLPQNEPKQVEKWDKERTYFQILEANQGKATVYSCMTGRPTPTAISTSAMR